MINLHNHNYDNYDIMIYCNFITVSYPLGFKYTAINPYPFCKIYPVLVYRNTIEKVLLSAKVNFTTPTDDGVRKPKSVGGNREY